MDQAAGPWGIDPTYKNLYRLGGVAALIVAILTVVEVIVFTFYPQPSTISDWFELFQSNPIIGLMDFWGLEVPMYAMFTIVYNPFSMLTLSRNYAAATTEVERSTLLAAGEAILANTNQRAIGGFNIGLLLISIAGLIVSVVMLRATSFSRSTAYIGILAFGLSLAEYIRQAFTSSVFIALLLILPGALLLVAWFSLVGRRLLQLGRLEE